MQNLNSFIKYSTNDIPLILGPMAGVTDLPFRILCKEQGADIVCTEMVSAKAILYNNKNTGKLLRTDGTESPIMLQLFGSDPQIVSDMALKMQEGPWDIIDFNMGCPVPKIVNNGEGSALMKNPELASEIISAMRSKLHKPVSVKIRKGFDDTCVNAVELAKRLEAAGASFITVHGRTREQYYHGKADLEIIRKVKEAVSIPVIGNGDVADKETFDRMVSETGCDGVMIARAALGNPWVFSDIKNGKKGRRSPEAVRDMMLRHLELQIEYDGEYMGLREMRKHIAWYAFGMKGAAEFRDRINHIESADELKAEIVEFSTKL